MAVVRTVPLVDGVGCFRLADRDLRNLRADSDSLAIHIGDSILPEYGCIIRHFSICRQAVRRRHRIGADLGDGLKGRIFGVVLLSRPSFEDLTSRDRACARIIDDGLNFLRSIRRLDVHGIDSRLTVDEVDRQSRNDRLDNNVHGELIRVEQSARCGHGRIAVHQRAFAVAVDMHDAALVLGRIDRLLGRADQHPHRFAVGRLDLFPVIFKGDVYRGYILGLDGVVLHGVLYGIDDVLRIDGLDFHRRSLGEDVLIRPDGHADAADLVEERHGRHVYGRLRLFLRGLIRGLFRGFLRHFGRLLRRDFLGNTRRLLCRFFLWSLSRSLRRLFRGFLRRNLRRLFRRDLWKFHFRFFRIIRLGCLGLFRIHGLDLCRLLRRSFRYLSRRLFRGDLRELYFGFFRSDSFLQCRLIRNLDLHRRSDGRQSRAEEQHQSQEHAEKSLKGRPGPTVPRTLHVCFLLFPADAMRSC